MKEIHESREKIFRVNESIISFDRAISKGRLIVS